jgi:hypothetical protein
VQAEKPGGVGCLDKVEDWRTRARKIRLIAETMLDAASRQSLLQIADDWEQMANLAEESEEEIATEDAPIAE